jgi:hypothetical protein
MTYSMADLPVMDMSLQIVIGSYAMPAAVTAFIKERLIPLQLSRLFVRPRMKMRRFGSTTTHKETPNVVSTAATTTTDIIDATASESGIDKELPLNPSPQQSEPSPSTIFTPSETTDTPVTAESAQPIGFARATTPTSAGGTLKGRLFSKMSTVKDQLKDRVPPNLREKITKENLISTAGGMLNKAKAKLNDVRQRPLSSKNSSTTGLPGYDTDTDSKTINSTTDVEFSEVEADVKTLQSSTDAEYTDKEFVDDGSAFDVDAFILQSRDSELSIPIQEEPRSLSELDVDIDDDTGKRPPLPPRKVIANDPAIEALVVNSLQQALSDVEFALGDGNGDSSMVQLGKQRDSTGESAHPLPPLPQRDDPDFDPDIDIDHATKKISE